MGLRAPVALLPRSRRIPDGPGPACRRIASHVVDRRSAERPHAAVDGGRARAARRQRRGHRRRAGATRRPRRLVDRPLVARALHHPRFRGRTAARSTTTTFASSSRPATWRSSTRWCTRRGSCRSTARRSATCAATWRFARPLGGRHARRRNAQLQRQGAVPRRGDESARHRALHARRPDRSTSRSRSRTTRSGRSRGRRLFDASGRRRAVRVRLPRGQLWTAQHPRECARRRERPRRARR